MLRTNTCGELTRKDETKEVTLCGWTNSRRDHGGIIFIDLRDRYGLTQAVFDPNHNQETHSKAEKLKREDCIKVAGKVRYRGKGLENHNLSTGDIEIIVDELDLLNSAETPPIEIDDRKEASEEMRLKYRYLDLRRPVMQKHIMVRHQVVKACRELLDGEGFIEIETPMLVRSTPEGARDYLVPSPFHPGKAYSLPQSPQIYKQLLMVSGLDKYYQIARCMRAEDSRADRQPEFTQIDIEMSFVDEDDVYAVGEKLFSHIMKQVKGLAIKTPFPQMSYAEALAKYGCDKPDLRFGLEHVEVSEIVPKSDFSVFKSAVDKGGMVKGINAKGAGIKFSRKEIDAYIAYAQSLGAAGLAWMKVTEQGLESSITKFFNQQTQQQLIKKMQAKPGDLLFFCAGEDKLVNNAMWKVRLKLGEELNLINKDEFNFCWVNQFPLFEWNADDGKWEAMHHIFTMPRDEDLKHLEEDPSKVRGKLYDLVLNGVELSSGSIRIHKPEIQERVMKIIGMSLKEAQAKFGFLLNAFKYGAPPHGGFAPGLDRLVMLIEKLDNIRDVIAFPKNKNKESPMDGCPSDWSAKDLKENYLKLDWVKK
ncbi:MAG TPA: aspartate--tRNA ligase [Candidatus Nanoarchaeia archaeon]|nr:aspartate--tRNA ligase [Candidatus Nanoarchaeia archaeon]